MTEKEIMDLAVKTFAQTVEYGAMCEKCCSTLGNNLAGNVLCEMSDRSLNPDDYCPQQLTAIESFAHELYQKLCPSGDKEVVGKIVHLIFDFTHIFIAKAEAEQIITLLREAGWVQLDEQNLPEIQNIASKKAEQGKDKNQWFIDGQAMAQGLMYQAGFRKVKL